MKMSKNSTVVESFYKTNEIFDCTRKMVIKFYNEKIKISVISTTETAEMKLCKVF